jgi:hypothetical protein
MKSAVESVSLAEENLVEATLSHSAVEVPGLQNNRRGHPDRLDPVANMIWAKNKSGAILGALANFAIHGVAYDDDNPYFSADVPGGIEKSLKEKITKKNLAVGREIENIVKPVVVFMNGAEGDTSPTYFLAEGIAKIGEIFSDQVISKVDQAENLPTKWNINQAKVVFGKAGLNIKNCVKEFNSGKPNRGLKFFSKDAKLKLISPFFPKSAELSAIQWGNMTLATWPGEPTAQLGFDLKAVIKKSGSKHALILGLTNDHLAYFTSPEEFYEGGYESCFSVYGSQGGQKVIQTYEKILIKN